MCGYAFVGVYNYAHMYTHVHTHTHSAHTLLQRMEEKKLHLSLGHLQSAGNAQILNAVKHTTEQTTRKPKTSKKFSTNKNPEAFQQKIEYEKQIQKYLLNQWTGCTSN